MKKDLKKILFVDDDEDIHLIVELCIGDIPNIEFRSVFSGQEAIRTIVDFQPDLILLDVMMPQMDGIATLQAIKLLPNFENTPVVFLTAKVQKNEVEKYLKLGVLDVIIKPFDPATLASKVLELWEKYQKSVS